MARESLFAALAFALVGGGVFVALWGAAWFLLSMGQGTCSSGCYTPVVPDKLTTVIFRISLVVAVVSGFAGARPARKQSLGDAEEPGEP